MNARNDWLTDRTIRCLADLDLETNAQARLGIIRSALEDSGSNAIESFIDRITSNGGMLGRCQGVRS